MDQQTLNRLVAELLHALGDLDLDAEVVAVDRPDADLEVRIDGAVVPVVVVHRADMRPVHARELPTRAEGVAGLVFADRIAQRTREALRERGWGWLDRRRGHLRIWHPGLRLDATVAPTVEPRSGPRARNPFTPAGLTLALWLLVHPDEAASPRALGRRLGISPGQISNLLAALGDHALLRRDRRPLVPELFWALVEQWHPRRHAVLSMPDGDELAASPELRRDEWVLTDTAAAAAYGAPLVAPADYPPDLYLPDEQTLSWLLGRCTLAPDYEHRVATVAVAPTPLVCDPEMRHPDEPWARAHPVVVALDLATDPARGREIVSDWTPDPDLGVTRVW